VVTKRNASDDDETQPDRTVDPNTMSAPDQAEYQRLQSERAAAQARGDSKTTADLDAQLAALQDRQ
jgi:hypothetical protein